ncbi:response regulator [Geovibrio ferrireducens]|uniref:response regulator n=1 Tax=Geovibrio ferrireducens TaxID=46201 RepID=UPI002247E9DF|nr:response regulator [Geovibrio ferrireducens]
MTLGGLLDKLNVLVVEDNSVNRRTMELVLEQMVGRVFTAADGLEGLELFRRREIDVVFTDHDMPQMTGLELAREILEEKPDTPVVLVTGHNESDVVISALNSGITHFLPKPITRKTIRRALEDSFQKVLVKKLEHESRRKDLELLRFKERYHSLQEKNAFEKQLNLIKNDFQGMMLENAGNPYFVNTFYKPLDTLSGDGYSVRRLSDGSIFVFLIDSMGKGLSASVTTFMSIAFINHIIDRFNERNGSGLSTLISRYLEYVKKVLLEEEIVSCAFLRISSGFEEMEYALFSVPSLSVSMPDGLKKLKSNNPPLMSSTESFNIGRENTAGMLSLAVFTDGLLENTFISTAEHKEMLYDLIKDNPPFMHMRTFLDSTVTSYEDDITFIYINSSVGGYAEEISVNPDFHDVMVYINGVEEKLRRDGLSDDDAASMTGVLTELVMNAFEHGCLEIELEEKTKLITEGVYDECLKKAKPTPDKFIKIRTRVENRGGSLVFCAEVSDNGHGFDFRKKRRSRKAFFGGNGIKMVTSAVDDIYFNEKGNKVRIYKTIRGECVWK